MQHVKHKIYKINKHASTTTEDYLVVEEPLQISISIPHENIVERNIAITMRTPGKDTELALGFLFSEDIIKSYSQIKHTKQYYNHVDIILNENIAFQFADIQRHFYMTSSCGVCGKSSVEAIRSKRLEKQEHENSFTMNALTLNTLPATLQKHQAIFDQTGGLHAAAIFNTEGDLLHSYEDVGRHNALDKLIGHYLINNALPLTNKVLLLSGRSSFELLQKACLAGIGFVASVGAPSSLALSLAEEFDITLVGFLKNDRFNIYHAPHRIER